MARRKKYESESVLNSRYSQWEKKIKKEDKIRNDKLFALEAAVDLMYADEILEKIIKAKSSIQIDNIMATQRLAC